MTFLGRSVITTWSLAAGDKASCRPASRLIATAPLAYGATATIATASSEAGLVATVSGTREEPAATSRARGFTAELSPADGLCELVPGARAHNDGVRAHGDSYDGAPRGRGHRDSIRRAGTATRAF